MTEVTASKPHPKWRRLLLPLLWLLAGISIYTTYSDLTRSEQTATTDPARVWGLLVANVLLLLGIVAIYARRILLMWSKLSAGFSSSKLQRRIVLVFGMVTMLPTLLVSIFAFFLFNLGIQSWFNERVQTALLESLAVAEAYLAEHKDNIRADAIAMARELDQVAQMSYSSPIEFNRYVSNEAEQRLLTEVIVFRGNRIIAQGRLSFALAFESMPINALERASKGEVVLLTDESKDKVRALVKLDNIEQGFLLVGRLVDSKVVSHMEATQGAYREYKELHKNLGRIQMTVSLLFVVITLLLLCGAVWYGLVFATRITVPIIKLASAAERVRGGDYSARVEIYDESDEIGTLSRIFNRMTEQMESQRGDLITANRSLDERRRFSEAVLGGVSAGVVALNPDKEITLANRSAESLLVEKDAPSFIGKPLADIVPEIRPLLKDLEDAPASQVQGTITHERGSARLTLHTRLAAEMQDKKVHSYIVTFDDITPLIAAQRHAAWSDVARRVAHEIKNPLTPIALAAERIKRKYQKLVGAEEEENLVKYTDTIAHHVGNIGQMVEEFVNFARMPTPVFKPENMNDIIKKAVFSEQVAHPSVEYRLSVADEALMVLSDERQMTQLLLNLMKNAAEAMEGGEAAEKPAITVRSWGEPSGTEGGRVYIEICDNGPGFPEGQLDKIMEPYVTNRTKGTGLGLAISKKIVEDHKGSIKLSNNNAGGACVVVSFSVMEVDKG